MARAGRRPGGADTRGEILTAARSTFASDGYHGATIRMIASSAGVDPALVHHYFGTKEDLFAACVQLPFRPVDIADQILNGGHDEIGLRVTTLFLSIWENPATRDALLVILRGAIATDQGAAVLREFFGSVMLDRVAGRLELPDAKLRVSLAVSHLIGVAVLRYIVSFPSLVDADVDDLIALIGPRIQGYFTV